MAEPDPRTGVPPPTWIGRDAPGEVDDHGTYDGSHTDADFDLVETDPDLVPSEESTPETSADLPAPVLLQGRPLDDLLEEIPPPAPLRKPPRPPRRPPVEQHLPFVPGGGVPVGLRRPFGPSQQWADPKGLQDFQALNSLFYKAWGRPPDSDFFRWDPEHLVYRAHMDPRAYPGGVERGWYEDVFRHHLGLASHNVYLQAYKEGGERGTGPWLYRWVSADLSKPLWNQKYVVLRHGYESHAYRGPSIADRQRELALRRGEQARILGQL